MCFMFSLNIFIVSITSTEKLDEIIKLMTMSVNNNSDIKIKCGREWVTESLTYIRLEWYELSMLSFWFIQWVEV